jgi:hypothetical protein
MVLLHAPVLPRPDQEVAPVSFSREFRYLVRRDDICTLDHFLDGCTLVGRLDVPALEAAFNDVIHRHDSLRATLHCQGGRLLQRIRRPERTPRLPLTTEQSPASEDDLALILRRDLEAPLDVAEGLPLRARLLRRSDDEHVLAIVFDHLYYDVAAMRPFWTDLEQAYVARRARRAPSWGTLPFQAPDFEAWQRQLVLGSAGAAQIAYWRRRLAGCEAPTLATDMPRRQETRGRGMRAGQAAELSAQVSRTQSARLEELARRSGASLYAVLLAHLAQVLGRRMGSKDVCVHSTYMHRDRPGTGDQVAYFGNSLVMRLDLSGEPTLEQLVARAMTTVAGAFSNAFAPVLSFPDEQADLPFREPLVSLDAVGVNFNYVLGRSKARQAQPRFADLEIKGFPGPRTEATRFDYIVFARGSPESLTISVLYNSDLFYRDTAQQLLSEYVAALSEPPGRRS